MFVHCCSSIKSMSHHFLSCIYPFLEFRYCRISNTDSQIFSFVAPYASGSHWCVRLILCKNTKCHFSLGPAHRAANIVHVRSCWWQRLESSVALQRYLSVGTERFPLSTLSCKTESSLLELPGPGPQGECKSLGSGRNCLKLSFHPPKCQLDLWREVEKPHQCLPSCWGWTGPLEPGFPLSCITGPQHFKRRETYCRENKGTWMPCWCTVVCILCLFGSSPA